MKRLEKAEAQVCMYVPAHNFCFPLATHTRTIKMSSDQEDPHMSHCHSKGYRLWWSTLLHMKLAMCAIASLIVHMCGSHSLNNSHLL